MTSRLGLDLLSTLHSVVGLLSGEVESEAALFDLVARSLDALGLRGAVLLRTGRGLELTVRTFAVRNPVFEHVERLTGLRTQGFVVDGERVDVYRRVLEQGETVFVPDTRVVLDQLLPAAARPFAGLLKAAITGTPAVYAPLMAGGHNIGLINAASATVVPEDAPAVRGFAAGISMALENLRHRHARGRGRARGDAVAATLRSALRGEPVATTLAGALEHLVEEDGRLQAAALAVLEPDELRVRDLHSRGAADGLADALRAGCPVGSFRPLLDAPDGQACLQCQSDHAAGCPLAGLFLMAVADRARLLGVLGARLAPGVSGAAVAADLRPLADALGTVLSRAEGEAARAAAEDRYRHAQRMEVVGQLAGGVAHDFNNLITSISLTATVVRDDLPPASPLRDDLQEIHSACERGARLTRQLLMFSRRQAGVPEPVDLSALLQGMQVMLGRLLGEDVNLHIETPDGRCPLLADRGSVEQLVLNLALNARDAMPEGGSLTLRVETAERPDRVGGARDGICLTVRDTGVGMDAVTRARAFEPFFTTKGTKGTGLGLAVVDAVVRAAHGRVELDSAPGAGTTFRVFFPRLADQSASAAGAAAPARSGVRGRVLLVEDEPSLGSVLRRYLAHAGHDVVLVRNVADARVQAAAASAFQALVSDVVLPDGNGVALAYELRTRQPALPVILLSGYLDDKNHLGEIQRHGYVFMGKPFRPDELLARLEGLLGAAAPPGPLPE
ncbi:MAG: response regulator [Deltaproteobacteria bacterium]|nr:response regulator [Deltaproteobacteria bacterium]